MVYSLYAGAINHADPRTIIIQRLSLTQRARSGLWIGCRGKVYFGSLFPDCRLVSRMNFHTHLDEWKTVHRDGPSLAERSIQQHLSGEIEAFTVEF